MSGPCYVFDKVCKGDTMRKFSSPAVVLALVACVSVATAGCSQIGRLKGIMAFKDANAAYQAGDYKKAAGKYEEAIAQDPKLTPVYFYLGNSYDNLYKPARKGEAENDEYLNKAVKNYEIAVQRETDASRKKLALQYLAASYGADKLNDPAKAEPVVRQMIQMDPKDTGSYYGLSKLYEDAGRFEEANLYGRALDRPERFGYDVVLVARAATKPRAVSGTEYVPGEIEGRAYVYDFASARVVCAADVKAKSSKQIGYVYSDRSDTPPSLGPLASMGDAIHEDIRLQTERAIVDAVRWRAGNEPAGAR